MQNLGGTPCLHALCGLGAKICSANSELNWVSAYQIIARFPLIPAHTQSELTTCARIPPPPPLLNILLPTCVDVKLERHRQTENLSLPRLPNSLLWKD